MSHGAKVNAKDRYNKTAYDLAFWPNCKFKNEIPNNNVQFISIKKTSFYRFCSERVFA